MIVDAVRAEWGKTWSLRSPFLCLAGASVLICATAWSLANDFVYGLARGDRGSGTTMEPIDAVAPAVQFGLLLLAAFVLLTVTSEYVSGSIRSTLLAEPRRWPMLAAKTAVSAFSAALVALVTVAVAGELVQLVLGDHAAAGASIPVTAARAALIVLVDAVIVVGLAVMVRHSVGALALSFVVFVATLALPSSVAVWSPAGAGSAFLTGDATSYPAVVGLVITASWAVAIYAGGVIVLRRRDA